MAEGEIFVAGWRQIRGGRSAGRCATVPRRLLPTSAPSVLQNLVVVDPDRLDVARFFALCGRPHRANYADRAAMPTCAACLRGCAGEAGRVSEDLRGDRSV